MAPNVLERSRPKTSILDFDPSRLIRIIQEKLAEKEVEEAYLFGSFATSTCSPWSDLDLVVILSTEAPFLERPREFDSLYDIGLPIDLLVYTPQEFAALVTSDSPFWRDFRRQKVRIV